MLRFMLDILLVALVSGLWPPVAFAGTEEPPPVLSLEENSSATAASRLSCFGVVQACYQGCADANFWCEVQCGGWDTWCLNRCQQDLTYCRDSCWGLCP